MGHAFLMGQSAPSPKIQEKTVIQDWSLFPPSIYIEPDPGMLLGLVSLTKDNNLTPPNIKDGISIFGVSGTYKPPGGGWSSYIAPANGQVTVQFPSLYLPSYVAISLQQQGGTGAYLINVTYRISTPGASTHACSSLNTSFVATTHAVSTYISYNSGTKKCTVSIPTPGLLKGAYNVVYGY